MPDEELRESMRRAHQRSTEIRERSVLALAEAERIIADLQSDGGGTRRIDALTEEVAGLRRALESRAVIEQAKGVVIAATGCNADEAFAILVSQSQHENRKLRDVAADLVAR